MISMLNRINRIFFILDEKGTRATVEDYRTREEAVARDPEEHQSQFA